MLRRAVFSRRTLAAVSGTTLLAAAGGYYYLNSGPAYPPSTKQTRRPPQPWKPPSREQMLDALRASARDPDQEFDLLVVGGGATGAGVALDAADHAVLENGLRNGDENGSAQALEDLHTCACHWHGYSQCRRRSPNWTPVVRMLPRRR